ncbi:hypothetical protein ACFWMJ_34690 [Streptomyces hawaiiensis]|uniref:hypothetical protein n=1 Tax=Streptomyces hawaiiensis TaxID=67305 RepID=UPI003658AF4A
MAAAAGVVSTPLVSLLDSPDTGRLVGASVQAATASPPWYGLPHPPPAAAPTSGPADLAVDTGNADGSGGGTAYTGVRRPGGAGTGSARAERTGDATVHGSGSAGVGARCPRISPLLTPRWPARPMKGNGGL